MKQQTQGLRAGTQVRRSWPTGVVKTSSSFLIGQLGIIPGLRVTGRMEAVGLTLSTVLSTPRAIIMEDPLGFPPPQFLLPPTLHHRDTQLGAGQV